MPENALIGYTGFVGSNLLSQSNFDVCFNTTNTDEMRSKSFDTVFCAGVSGTKWLANKNPEEDWRKIGCLLENLRTVQARRFVLISTVDVYAPPLQVTESSPLHPDVLQPYGKHRYQVEEFARSQFPNLHIIRLPGIYGRGLKKNQIYDLLHDNCLEQLHPDGVYQYYSLSRLSRDIDIAVQHDLRVLNIAVPPVSLREIAWEVFNRPLDNCPESPPVSYDMRTQYAALFGENGGYIMSREREIEDLKVFVREQTQGS